jgi:hypothetical protein
MGILRNLPVTQQPSVPRILARTTPTFQVGAAEGLQAATVAMNRARPGSTPSARLRVGRSKLPKLKDKAKYHIGLLPTYNSVTAKQTQIVGWTKTK